MVRGHFGVCFTYTGLHTETFSSQLETRVASRFGGEHVAGRREDGHLVAPSELDPARLLRGHAERVGQHVGGIPRMADVFPTMGAFMASSLVWNDTHANPSSSSSSSSSSFPARAMTAKLCGTTSACPRLISPSNTRRPAVAYTSACAFMFQCGARIAF
ncbi:hypothetical protein PR202_ga23079 [Eleusine coracana subsp. coracana]|uniref:Uncharacterized protein n=1 Tax=Eleusine coracana subsp. coracana TaxID=191504 RepID=A0AAV5D5M3_ELECO|nr:hypothetical protein PR202_ga23079 [Eleusine coracana subsp. coracana]